MKTDDDFISVLAADGARVRRRGGAWMPVLVGTAFAASLTTWQLGFRPDLAAAVTAPRFLFKVAIVLTLAAAAAGLVARLRRPEGTVAGWPMTLFAAAGAALAAGVLIELAIVPPSEWVGRAIGGNALRCLVIMPALGLAPLAGVLLALRRGAPARPSLAGAAAGLLGGAIAATLYATTCPDDSPLFVSVWYPLAIAGLAVLGGIAGRFALRW